MNLRQITMFLLLLTLPYPTLAQGKLPPETRNAALRYWMAFAEINDPPAGKATQELLEKTAAGEAGWDEGKLGPILDANATAIRMFQRASKLPDCDWGIEYSLGPRASIAYVPRARVLARLNTLQGMREMARGQSQAAVDTWLAGIRFTDHLSKGGSLIFALIAKSTLVSNLRVLKAEATQGRLNSLQKKQLYAAVNAIPDDGFDWSRAWEIEEAAAEPFFAELQRSKNPGALYESVMGGPAPKICVPPSVHDVQVYDGYMNQVAAALRLPPSAAKDRIATLDSEAERICEAIRKLIPSPQHVNDARIEVIATRGALLEVLQNK